MRTHITTERYCLHLHSNLLIKQFLNPALTIIKNRFSLFLPATMFQNWRMYLLNRNLFVTVYFQQVFSCWSSTLVSHCRRKYSLLCSNCQCYSYVKLSQEDDRCFLDSKKIGIYGRSRKCLEYRWNPGEGSKQWLKTLQVHAKL